MERINCDLVVTKPMKIIGDIVITGNLYASADITACNIDVDGDIILLTDSEAVIDAYNIRCKVLKARNFIMHVDSITVSEGVRLESDNPTDIILQGDNVYMSFDFIEGFDPWEDD